MSETVLGDIHRKLGGQMVPFGGWSMPLHYADITSEHHAVRKRAGLFDISHMGRFRVRGPQAAEMVAAIQTCNAPKLRVGRVRYGLICNEAGGVIDDVLVYREEDGVLVVVNAGNRDRDLAVFQEHAARFDAEVIDASEDEAMIAIQGPAAVHIMGELGLTGAAELGYYTHGSMESSFGPVQISRTGYTGEDGFEIIVARDRAVELHAAAMEAGQPHLVPCGLGCRDTLRLEAGMPLYGHELSEEINPLEAGLSFAVRLKHDFVGSDALRRVRDEGPKRVLVGLIVEGRRIPRDGYPVQVGGADVGSICSGTRSPTLDLNIATALILGESASSAETDGIQVMIRGHAAPARITKLPFYEREKE